MKRVIRPLRHHSLPMFGREPRIIGTIWMKPFVKGQSNDHNDAGSSCRSLSDLTFQRRRAIYEQCATNALRPPGSNKGPMLIAVFGALLTLE
jgi:hypothetical protein